MTLEQVTADFVNPDMVSQVLASLGWREASYRVFAADNVPTNAAGWLEITVHRFDTVIGASDALPVLAWERQKLAGLSPIPFGLFSDQSMALSGPAFNGNEISLYARRGNLIVHVIGITPVGDPSSDVIESIMKLLVPLATDPRVVTPEMLELLPNEEDLRPGLTQTEERARSASNTAETFINPEETAQLFQDWGWLESAGGVYLGSTSNGTTRFETVVYRWRDEAGAAAAMDYFIDSRATALDLAEVPIPPMDDEARAISGPVSGGSEATVYLRSGNFLFRFTAIGDGNPMADVLYLLGGP